MRELNKGCLFVLRLLSSDCCEPQGLGSVQRMREAPSRPVGLSQIITGSGKSEETLSQREGLLRVLLRE